MMRGICCFCKQAMALENNPQPPEQTELETGRATPEEKFVMPEHEFHGVACHGSGIIPEMLEQHIPHKITRGMTRK